MAIAHVQTATGDANSSATTISLTYGSAPTENNLLVAIVERNPTTASLTTREPRHSRGNAPAPLSCRWSGSSSPVSIRPRLLTPTATR